MVKKMKRNRRETKWKVSKKSSRRNRGGGRTKIEEMDYYGVPIMEPERSLELNFTSPADCGFCIH
jgi:hypothetical protein